MSKQGKRASGSPRGIHHLQAEAGAQFQLEITDLRKQAIRVPKPLTYHAGSVRAPPKSRLVRQHWAVRGGGTLVVGPRQGEEGWRERKAKPPHWDGSHVPGGPGAWHGLDQSLSHEEESWV